MFNEIPTERPGTPLLDRINSPFELRQLQVTELEEVAYQLRHFLLYSVGQTGGHFGAGLGVVELTIALHYSLNTPLDQLIWDVGHQTYPHKILTGRREQMSRLRRPDGLAPFPSREESEFDAFGTGHSSTSISAALGIERAGRLSGQEHRTVAVIGDGAMTAGMAFEALNHVAASQANVLVILNDNAMSISENVGGLANYFARNISADSIASNKEHPTGTVPGGLFKDLGFDYTGPVDGHDLAALISTLGQLRDQSGPRLLHVVTRKGKGYGPAEASPVDSHALTKLEKPKLETPEPEKSARDQSSSVSCSTVFGQWAADKASSDDRLVMITPAMKEGSGLANFARHFPERFHDVAIAEQHAVTFAAGLATGGAKPIVAIYSTFLQRAYDQLIHDVAIQKLDVLFAVDRASLLEDGPTHSGVFDLSFCRAIPNLMMIAPSSAASLRALLDFGYEHKGPCVIRYPRGALEPGEESSEKVEGIKGRIVQQGARVAILSFGAVLPVTRRAAQSRDYTLADMQFVKPLDTTLITQLAREHELLVTVEENATAGGAGTGVAEYLSAAGLTTPVLHLGIPDQFILQDEPSLMQSAAGLTEEGILNSIDGRLSKS